jgi:hypothetical protein
MPHKFAVAMAAAVALAAALHDPAPAGTLDGFSAGGSGYSYGLGGHSGAVGAPGASSRSGVLGPLPSTGMSHRYDLGGVKAAAGIIEVSAETSIPAGVTTLVPSWVDRAADPIRAAPPNANC